VRSGTGNQYSSVRYVRIDVTSDAAGEDVAFGAEGYWHVWPALDVDRDNNIAITFTRTSLSEYPAAAFTWRLDSDPQGLRPTEVFRPGASTYVRLANGRNRWGDYMGIAIDPVDRNEFWMAGETVPSLNTWGSWIHSMRLVPFTGARATTSAEALDFGSIEAGYSDTLSLSITNVGSDALTISALGPQDPAFSVLGLPPLPASIPTYDSLTLQIVFSPPDHGLILDTLRIVSNDTTRPPGRVALRGKGVVIGTAVPGVLYASSAGNPGSLYTVNTTTGTATLVGSTGVNELQSLAVHPVTRELIGVYATAARATLYRVSTAHGDALPMTTVPMNNMTMRAIAFGGDDTLYGGTTTGRLFRVNAATGDTALIGVATGIAYSGFSFSPHTHVLWASVRPALVNRDRIYTVSTSTGAATLVGATGDGAITPSIAFDPTGRLYALKGTGTVLNTLILIDTITAAGTLIGSTGVSGLIAIGMRSDSLGSVAVTEAVPSGVPEEYVLLQNYPNPFNPATSITYGLPEPSDVVLRVFDVTGKEIRVITAGAQSAGFHTLLWDGTNHAGAQVASGVYFCALDARSSNGGRAHVTTRKMMLIR